MAGRSSACAEPGAPGKGQRGPACSGEVREGLGRRRRQALLVVLLPARGITVVIRDTGLVVRLLHGKTHSTIRQSRNPIGFQDGPIWLIL